MQDGTRAPPPVPLAYARHPSAYLKASLNTLAGRSSSVVASGSEEQPSSKTTRVLAPISPPPPPPSPPPTSEGLTPAQPRKQTEVLDLDELGKGNGGSGGSSLFARACNSCMRSIRDCQKSNHALERAIVCAVAVALLWLTSLGLCQAIVHYFIIVPSMDVVLEKTSLSLNKTEQSRMGYDACATRQLEDCGRAIQFQFDNSLKNMSERQQFNIDLMSDLYLMRDWCAVELDNGIKTIDWVQSNYGAYSDPLASFPTNYTNSDARCGLVAELLKGRNGGMLALGASSRFANDADTTATESLNAYDARAAYDEWYFANKSAQYGLITNKTLRELVKESKGYFANLNKTHDQYMACVSPNNAYKGEVCDEQSVLYRFALMQTEAISRYNEAKATTQYWVTRANDTITKFNNFYNSIKNNHNLLGAFDVLLNFNGLSLESIGFYDVTGPVSFSGLNFGSVSGVDVNALLAQYEQETRAYLASVAAEQQRAAQDAADLIAAQAALPSTSPFPVYDPPPVDTANQREQFSNHTGSLVDDMGQALTSVSNTGSGVAEYAVESNVTFIRSNDTTKFLSSLRTRVFGFFVYDGFAPETFAQAYEDLINNCLIFDYLFRAVYTLQLIIKYWRVSAITTPPADVRTDLMQDKGLAVDTRSPLARLAAFVAHPATQILVIFIFAAIMCSVFLNMYLPLYNNFVEGCVHNDHNGPGSMLSRNAYAISHNYAAANGNRITTIEIDRLNAQKEVDCTRELDSSQRVQRQVETDYDLVFRAHQDSQYQAKALADCLDIGAIQTAVPNAASTATANNISSLHQALPGPNCAAPVPRLRDAIFQCALVSCETQRCAQSVNEADMRSYTWTAACVTEDFMHTTFLTMVMIIIVFILINVSRIFSLRGLVRMYWRYLSDGRFTYLGTCERDGELRYPSIITVEGYSMRRAIQESLRVRIFYWEAKAWSIFLFGMGLNIPWIAVLVVLKNNTFAGRY